jgi:gamma-D-glutamyl-L-lysine dipeptidyl-peptidase
MKSQITFAIFVFTLLLSCHPKSVDLLQSEIDGVAKRWVPDKRVGLCNFKLENGSGDKIVLKGETIYPDAKTEVLQLLKNKGISVTDSSVILPDSVSLKKVWGVVSLSIANLRSKPAHSSELVSQALMGTPVRVLKIEDGWVLVQTPDRYIAWTNQAAVHLMSSSEMIEWRNGDRLIYTESNGSVYEDSKQTVVMSDLVAGAIVTKKSESKNITEVSLPDGRVGFVTNQNWRNFKQMKDTVSLIGDNLIIAGKRFLGFPYLWGGTSSKAMDCSGFVKTVYFLNGVVLERDASQQINHGKEIDISSGYTNLQKGDLLYFGSKQPYKVTHTGMYIGDSEFIHSSGFIHINSLDKNRSNYNSELVPKLVGARRVIGNPPEQGCLPVKQHDWY